MKSNSSQFLTMIESGTIDDFFVMVKIDLHDTTVSYTSLPHDIGYSGNTYLSTDLLLEFEAPRISDTLDREVYKIKLNDSSNFFAAQFDQGVTGAEVEVYLAFVIDGEYKLDPGEVIFAYGGTIDEVTRDTDYQSYSKEVVLECSSPMADLDMAYSFITSRKGMDQVDATDTAFTELIIKC